MAKQFSVFFKSVEGQGRTDLWTREKNCESREEAERYIKKQEQMLDDDDETGKFRFHIVEFPE
jgi:hypothetical protein